MHEDVDDFEPDWKSYYSMDDEERKARRDKYKIYDKYSEGKITYENYLKQIDDPYYYGVLDKDERGEIKKMREKQKEEQVLRKRKELAEWNRRQKVKKENEQIFTIVFVIIVIITFLIALLK